MRKDMAKVIVERPRRGSRGPFKHGRRKNIPLDALPTKTGIRRSEHGAGRELRELNEHLGPLKRYLRKQVGRRWDDVYRDISENLRVTNAVQQHVRDHVRMEVEAGRGGGQGAGVGPAGDPVDRGIPARAPEG